MKHEFERNGITSVVYNMDCMEGMKQLPDNSIDSIVTDPPYELGFMGKAWDNTGIAYSVDMWAECLRVLKPGGHLLAFGGTRTYHRMAVAIEDAGFEIRDMIEWVYGSGFPKSLNIGKAFDKLQGNEREVVGTTKANGMKAITKSRVEQGYRKNLTIANFRDERQIDKGTSEWEGWGTALKPAHEPICMARKPLSEKTVAENCLKWGTGGINIDDSRVEYQGDADKASAIPQGKITTKVGEFAGRTQGGGTDKEINRDEWKDKMQGRFPANLIHDNSEEVRECFPETKSGKMTPEHTRHTDGSPNDIYGRFNINHPLSETIGDSGNASRFFKSILYYPKASKGERNKGCEGLETKQTKGGGGMNDSNGDDVCGKYGSVKAPAKNNHPTVKPVALMQYLVTLVTPKGGTVLDPFAGSGTTGVGCQELGFNCIMFELEEPHIEIIKARLSNKQLKLF